MYSQMRELESLKPVLAQPVLMWTHIWRAGVCKLNISIDYSVFGWSLSIRSYYILFKTLLAVVNISYKVGCYILYNFSIRSYKPKCPILQAVNFVLIVTVVKDTAQVQRWALAFASWSSFLFKVLILKRTHMFMSIFLRSTQVGK